MSGGGLGAAEAGEGTQPHSSNKRRCHHSTEGRSKRSKKHVDHCKVYVFNLPNKATEDMLYYELIEFAHVKKITFRKYKKGNKSKKCAVVKVESIQDVQLLLVLRKRERNILGQTFTIRGARNRVRVPGDAGYVRLPLSDRDFDLASPEPEQPSIHMLVDDIILRVFSYLPLQCLLTCEGVCRRWQALLLHQYFSTKTSLELSNDLLGMLFPRTEAVIPKFLILAGPNLRSLKIHDVGFWGRCNILQIIGRLCPQLEYLEVTLSEGIDFSFVDALAAGCRNMKGFVAWRCDFSKSDLYRLLKLFPKLEKLNVLETEAYLKDCKILPTTLKELHIDEYLHHPDKNTIPMIADRCPNLEALTLMKWEASAASLMYIANTCHKLTKLSVNLDKDNGDNYLQALSAFKQLKELDLCAATLDLNLLFKSLPQLEHLSLSSICESSRLVDFSVLKKLKSLETSYTELTEASLKTVAKCREIERIVMFTLSKRDMVVAFLEGCPKLKEMVFPHLVLSMSLIFRVDSVMQGRPGRVVIKTKHKRSLLELADYDRNKIQFRYPPRWMLSNYESVSESADSDRDIFGDIY